MLKGNLCYVIDNELGGLVREYRKIDRTAEVGDQVYLGFTKKVVSIDSRDFSPSGYVNVGPCDVVIPTGIVLDRGEKYRLSHRKAEEGDLVVHKPSVTYNSDGVICAVQKVFSNGNITINWYMDSKGMLIDGFLPGDYLVLDKQSKGDDYMLNRKFVRVIKESSGRFVPGAVVEVDESRDTGVFVRHPEGMNKGRAFLRNYEIEAVESSDVLPKVEPDEASSDDTTELIANLARRVHELEREIATMGDNFGELEEDVSAIESDHDRSISHMMQSISDLGTDIVTVEDGIDDRIDMLSDDIVLLDERTESLRSPVMKSRV